MEERLKRIWDLGYDYAAKRGFRDLAEDFAQEYTLWAWQQELKGKTFVQPPLPFINFLRRTYGRYLSSAKGKRSQNVPLEEYHLSRFTKHIDLDHDEALRVLLSFCKTPMERGAFVLRHSWGLHDSEIAEVFQVSGGRICQITREVMTVAAEVMSHETNNGRKRREKTNSNKHT